MLQHILQLFLGKVSSELTKNNNIVKIYGSEASP